MPGRGRDPAGSAAAAPLSADEFAARFQASARTLWVLAAGVLGDPSEAEDVLQEACVMALSKLDRFERDTNFDAWMGSFVRFVALNSARKRRRRATRPVDPETLGDVPGSEGEAPGSERAAGGPTGLPVDGRGELRRDQGAFDDDVLAGLRGLSAVQRSALLLRTVLELSYREIARTLEIPEGTAMSHVHRARTSLRERLMEAEGALEMEGRA